MVALFKYTVGRESFDSASNQARLTQSMTSNTKNAWEPRCDRVVLPEDLLAILLGLSFGRWLQPL